MKNFLSYTAIAQSASVQCVYDYKVLTTLQKVSQIENISMERVHEFLSKYDKSRWLEIVSKILDDYSTSIIDHRKPMAIYDSELPDAFAFIVLPAHTITHDTPASQAFNLPGSEYIYKPKGKGKPDHRQDGGADFAGQSLNCAQRAGR